jgi:hypothetical protein
LLSAPLLSEPQLWETEVSSLKSTFDASIANGLFWAQNIHDAMTVAHANAWNYWWLISLNADNEGLLGQDGQLTKRLFAVDNYSKFVRPAWVNIGETDDGGVSISAFKDPITGQFAVVVVNSGAQVTEQFNLNGFEASTVSPWVTSAADNLVLQPAIATTGGGSGFTATLAAQSVTTFVGQGAAVNLPSTPQGLAVASGIGAATLTWSPSTGATSYNIYRGMTSGEEGSTPYWTGITTTSFTDIGLTDGQQYFYQVSAVNTVGEGGRSQEVVASPQAAGLGANLLINPGFETGTATPWGTDWAAVTTGNAHGGTYSAVVYGSSSGGIWQNVTGLTPNTTYTLSAYVENSPGATAFLFAKEFGGQEVDESFNSSSYVEVSLTFTTGPTNTSAQIGLWKLSGTAYADDFDLAAVVSAGMATATRAGSPAPGHVGGRTTVAIASTGLPARPRFVPARPQRPGVFPDPLGWIPTHAKRKRPTVSDPVGSEVLQAKGSPDEELD